MRIAGVVKANAKDVVLVAMTLVQETVLVIVQVRVEAQVLDVEDAQAAAVPVVLVVNLIAEMDVLPLVVVLAHLIVRMDVLDLVIRVVKDAQAAVLAALVNVLQIAVVTVLGLAQVLA